MTRAEKWLIVAGAGKITDASECWHSQITEGIEAAGGVHLTTPVGDGRRVEYGDWPVLKKPMLKRTQRPNRSTQMDTEKHRKSIRAIGSYFTLRTAGVKGTAQ